MKELVDYFIARTDERFDRLEAKVDRLNNFKVKVVATVIAAGVIFQAFLEYGHKFIGGN